MNNGEPQPWPEDAFAPDPEWSDDDFAGEDDRLDDEAEILVRLWAGVGVGSDGAMSSNNVWGADAPEEETRSIIGVLQSWALSMQGVGVAVEMRLPDPGHKWQGRVPSMTEIDAFIVELDEYIEREWRNWGKSRGYDASTNFTALAPAQRLALFQELDGVIEPNPSDTQREKDRIVLTEFS